MSTYSKPSDTKHRIHLESRLIYANWQHRRAHAGQEAPIEVKTSLVGNGALIKIICRTENGRKLCTTEGTVYNNRFTGDCIIPEKVKENENIYFEARLPKHGLKGESNVIPVRSPLQVTRLYWDREKVSEEEVVIMTCIFTEGIVEGDHATVTVYEHNPNSCDLRIVTIPTTIKNNRIELRWKFEYQGDIWDIPTEEEMNRYGKHYFNPAYYFIVDVDGLKVGENRESGLLVFRDWLEIVLSDEHEFICENIEYDLIRPDGTVCEIVADSKGFVRIEDVPPGRCKVVLGNEKVKR